MIMHGRIMPFPGRHGLQEGFSALPFVYAYGVGFCYLLVPTEMGKS